MAEFKYEIQEEFGVLSDTGKGWTRELNLISWNEGKPKYDIRDWHPTTKKWVRAFHSQKMSWKHFTTLSVTF